MMKALDPTYPLYPVVEILATVMLLLVLTTSAVRHSWNLGVIFLCFWLPLELASSAAGHIIWSDNGHRTARFHAFCDIFSRLQIVCYVVKPMATLILSRRLCMIASLRPIAPKNTAARRWDIVLEWSLGFIIPLIVAGPLYYVVQRYRFVVNQGLGCANSHSHSILSMLLIEGWLVVPPLLSVVLYYPKVIKTFLRQRRDIEQFIQSSRSDTAPHISYTRLLILASVDILLMLPCGLASIILYTLELGPMPFQSKNLHLHHHQHSTIKTVNWEELTNGRAGAARIARIYFLSSTSPVLAFTIFGLFGLTSEARGSYHRMLKTAVQWLRWNSARRGSRENCLSLDPIEFGERPQTQTSMLETMQFEPRASTGNAVDRDVKGSRTSLDSGPELSTQTTSL